MRCGAPPAALPAHAAAPPLRFQLDPPSAGSANSNVRERNRSEHVLRVVVDGCAAVEGECGKDGTRTHSSSCSSVLVPVVRDMGEGVREFARSALENAVAEYAGGAPLLQADGAGDGVRVAQEGERGGERGGGALRTQYGGAARGAQAGRLLRRRKARARSERMWSCCGMRDELRRGFDLTCEESAQQKSSLTAIGSCIWAFQLLSDEGEDKNGIG
ncbi:hypothetical protein C8J57DRAFT_1572228 [Mycena rebaudengoi]|nr:hypothetical protein C8J57DRAFT_1572228 [Mycena rebaudengoi]